MKPSRKFLLMISIFALVVMSPNCADNSVDPSQDQPDYTAPSNVSIIVLSQNKLTVTWQVNSKNVRQFSVERKIGNYGTYQVIQTGSITVNSIVDSIPNADSLFSYRLRVHNMDVYGPYSEEVSINRSLKGPSGLSVLSFNDRAITLSWNDSSFGESQFLIERKSLVSSFTPAGYVDSNVTTFSDSSILDGGTQYSYRVRAIGKSDLGVSVASIPSNEANVTLTYNPPTNLITTIAAETSAVLQWVDNTSSETKFIIERKTGNSFSVIDSVGSNVTAYTDVRSFQTNTFYSYRVRAVSQSRRSPYSNIDSNRLVFSRPTNLVTTSLPDRGIQLTWIDNSSFESGFQIERKIPGTNSFQVLSSSIPPNTVSYTDTVTPKYDDSYYSYRVKALTLKGNTSEYSALDSIKFVFLSPSNIQVTNFSKYSIKLDWQDNSANEQAIRIERTNLITSMKDSVTLAPNTTSHTYSDLNFYATYQFKIKSLNGVHESRYSPSVRSSQSTTDVTFLRTIQDSTEVFTVAIDSSGTLAASAGLDGKVRLWNTLNGTMSGTLSVDSTSAIKTIAISPKNDRIAVGHEDGTIRMWDLSLRTLLWSKKTGSAVFSISWDQAGNVFATGHADQLIHMWNPMNGTLIRTLTGHQSAVYSVKFSYSGATIVSASADQSIKLWNANTGAEIKSIPSAHSGILSHASFLHPSDSSIISSGSDGLIKIWQVSSSKVINTLSGHANSTNGIISPNLRSIISVGADKSMKIWNADPWNLNKSIPAHNSSINSVSISNNRDMYITGSSDKTIIIWTHQTAWSKH